MHHAAPDSSPERFMPNRRALLISAAGVVSSLSLARIGLAAQADPDYDDKDPGGGSAADRGEATQPGSNPQDAPGEPGAGGAALLQAWMMGELTRTVLPDPAWSFFLSQIGNYGFFLPADWTVSESGDPTPIDFSDGFITTTQAVAPDRSAAFTVYDVSLMPFNVELEDFVNDTLERLADGARYEVIAQASRDFEQFGTGMSVAVRSGTEIAALQIFRIQIPDQSTGGVFTSFATTIEISNADAFDDLAESLFLPMLSNFQRYSGGGDGDDPTPTPTPIGG